jgi:hypothetical protein
MSYIVVNVEEPIAKAFNEATIAERTNLTQLTNFFLKKKLIDKNKDAHKKFLDGLSEEAKRNGLTSDILATLLEENE